MSTRIISVIQLKWSDEEVWKTICTMDPDKPAAVQLEEQRHRWRLVRQRYPHDEHEAEFRCASVTVSGEDLARRL